MGRFQVAALGKANEVLAEGTSPEVAPHRVMEGNRPTSVLLTDVIGPFRLGTLVALYELSMLLARVTLRNRIAKQKAEELALWGDEA